MRILRLIWPGILGATFGSSVTAIFSSPLDGLRVFGITVCVLYLLVAALDHFVGREEDGTTL